MARAAAVGAEVRPNRRRGIVGLVLGLVGVAILCTLGIWQVERLRWKEGVIRQIDARTHAAPQPAEAVAALAARTGDVEYTPVEASGRFLDGAERFFISTYEGEAGWNVYVPLDLGADRFVWINRGFVPYERRDPATRREGLILGETSVTGLARDVAREKPSWLVPANDTGKNQFFWKSLADLAVGANLPAGAVVLPFVIDAGPGRVPGGWPVGGTTVIDIPNNHLQYALTWFGLALVLLAMLGYQVVRTFRPGPPDADRG